MNQMEHNISPRNKHITEEINAQSRAGYVLCFILFLFFFRTDTSQYHRALSRLQDSYVYVCVYKGSRVLPSTPFRATRYELGKERGEGIDLSTTPDNFQLSRDYHYRFVRDT